MMDLRAACEELKRRSIAGMTLKDAFTLDGGIPGYTPDKMLRELVDNYLAGPFASIEKLKLAEAEWDE